MKLIFRSGKFHPTARAAVFVSIIVQMALCGAAETGWPEGYAIRAGSLSPDGRYGVLLPDRETAADQEEDEVVNTLVNLRSHRRLADIRGAHYFPGRNHRGLEVVWAPDSSWCVVTYEDRYGFGNITAIRIRNGECTQTDIGRHIQKALETSVDPRAGDVYGSAHFHPAPGGKILVLATGYTNPKGFDDVLSCCSMFEGTFDTGDGKWMRSKSREIDDNTDLESACSEDLGEGITFNRQEDRLEWYDARLNEAYRALRTILPADRFSALKKEQIAWLKQLEAAGSNEEKCNLIVARIKELRQLVW